MSYKREIGGNNVLSYEGRITSKMLSSFLLIIEERLKSMNESTKVLRKMYNIMVEVLHNLFHHSNIGEESSPVHFSITEVEEFYFINTENFINNGFIEKLESRINYINSLGKEELRAHYRDVLSDGKVSQKGGGGLGLIDMARKSANKVDFSFKKIDEHVSLFRFTIKINR